MWILIVAFTLTAGQVIAPIGSFPTESACAEYLIQLNTEDVLQELPALAKDVQFKCVKHPENYSKEQSL
jgi:hypothetical protein